MSYNARRSFSHSRPQHSRYGGGNQSRPFNRNRGSNGGGKGRKIVTFDPSMLVEQSVNTVAAPKVEYVAVNTFADFHIYH